jgi:mutual gliding-motility protein MglA
MVQINFALKEVSCKIVYYGPGMSGKTTNLEIVHEKAPESNKGDLTSIATEGDRTLFFDFMPLDLGNIAGMRTKFQLYTVPGQVYYNSTRKLVLQGVDGIVFVADSQASMVEENLESFENLKQNLEEYGKSIKDISVVLQYNKRDLPNALSEDELNARLNTDKKYRTFSAVATTGEGVFPTLKALAGLVLESLNRDRRPAGGPTARPAATAAPGAAPEPALATPRREPVKTAATKSPQPATAVAPARETEIAPAADARSADPRKKTKPDPFPSSAPARRPVRRSRAAPKVQKVVLDEDRGTMMMMGVLVLIILAAAGVILFSFDLI